MVSVALYVYVDHDLKHMWARTTHIAITILYSAG